MSREGKAGLALLTAAVGLGVLGDSLFHGAALGLNVVLFVVAFVGVLAVLLRIGRAPLHQGRRWMLLPLLLFALPFAWRDSQLLVAVNLLAIGGAVALGALRRTEPRVAHAGVVDYAAGLGAAAFSAFAGAIRLIHRDVPWDEAGNALRGTRAVSAARGIALGLPLLALFGGLFLAADAVFRSLASSLVPSFADPVAQLGLIFAFAWLSAGLLRDLVAVREDARIVSPAAVSSVRAPRLGRAELAIALAALDLLFLAFVLVQLRYLFGGRELVLARAHLTYADYARHGFFELVAVSVLVLPVLLAANAVARAKLVRALSLALVALVFVVMASALQRMRLYEQEYGLTELRLYATGVILWLAVVFVWLAATVLRGRPRLFAVGALVAGFAASLAINLVGPDGLIARTNLSRPHVDVQYLARLSDDAVPTLVDRLPALTPPLRRELAGALLRREESRADWRSWNVSRVRARETLASHRAELVRFAK